MLATKTITIDEAIADIDDTLAELEATVADLDDESARAQAIQSQMDALRHRRDYGLVWVRDDAGGDGWGGDAELTLGAPTAGDEMQMFRAADDAATEREMGMWYAAAGTVDAPYAGDGVVETFHALSDLPRAFVEWAEAQVNTLGMPSTRRAPEDGSDEGNENAPSSTPGVGSDQSTTSADGQPSTDS
jgi:hypothetical protein